MTVDILDTANHHIESLQTEQQRNPCLMVELIGYSLGILKRTLVLLIYHHHWNLNLFYFLLVYFNQLTFTYTLHLLN